MNLFTQQQLQELIKYKTEKASTKAEDEQKNLISIMNMTEDLMNTIKNHEKHSWTVIKKNDKKNNKNLLKLNYDRHCYTQRRNSPNNSLTSDELSDFQERQTEINHQKNLIHGVSKFEFLQLQEVEKSEYIPMKKRINPQKISPPKKQAQIKNMNNKVTMKKNDNKVKNLTIETQKKIPIKKQPSRTLIQTKSSQTLTTPVKHFKKHVLQDLQQKRQAQQKKYCQTPKHKSIKDFYSSNTDHIPLYEKSKILQVKKQIKKEQFERMKQWAEVQPLTFQPLINSKSQQLIEGTTFYSRLQDTMGRKEINQIKIMYETMKPCTFVPKLNQNNLSESKVRKIWQDEKLGQSEFDENIIREEDDEEQEKVKQIDRNWLTIKLGREYAQQLFMK